MILISLTLLITGLTPMIGYQPGLPVPAGVLISLAGTRMKIAEKLGLRCGFYPCPHGIPDLHLSHARILQEAGSIQKGKIVHSHLCYQVRIEQ